MGTLAMVVTDNTPVIPLSGWMALSPVTSATAGFAATAGRCMVSGGRYGGLLKFLLLEWRVFAMLAVVDLLGGSIAAGAIWALSPPRIQVVGSLSASHPWLLWAVVGFAGPFVVNGALRLLPARMTTSFPKFVFDHPSAVAQVVVYRKKLTTILYDAIDQANDAWLADRDDWIMTEVARQTKAGLLPPPLIARWVGRALDKSRTARGRSAMSQEPWSAYLAEESFTSKDVMAYEDLVLRIAESAIDRGLAGAVASSCRIRLNSFKARTTYSDLRIPDIAVELPNESFEPFEGFDSRVERY